MIWFFLAGFISGAVGTVMLAHWWVHSHMTVVHLQPENDEDEQNKEEEAHE